MDWLKYKKIYFMVSGLLIAVGIYGLFTWGLPLGLDFKGGTNLEYSLQGDVSEDEIAGKLQEIDIEASTISKSPQKTYLLRLPSIEISGKDKITQALTDLTGSSVAEIRFETVGPSVGPELIKKTVYAIVIAAVGILFWVAIQFKSIKFGASAILAMFHDSFILVGSFSLLGHYLGAEVDFLFVTALLTTLSFSVHDTIVVYDRIRESQKIHGRSLVELANDALTETMVRSLNNSFTIIFMLLALVLLGGITVKWFAVALLIGTIMGTYSSPFVAVPLLVTWDEISNSLRNKSKGK